MIPDSAVSAKVWLIGAALAGGITSVVTQKGLSITDRIFSALLGFFASIFIAPAILAWWLPRIPADSPFVAAFYYLVALLSMSAVPPLLKWVKSGGILRLILRISNEKLVEHDE